MGKNNLIPICKSMSKFTSLLLYTFILLSITIIPVFSQVHIKERIEITPKSSENGIAEKNLLERLHNLMKQNPENTLNKSGLESISSFNVPLYGKDVFLSKIILVKFETRDDDPPSGTGMEDLNFSIIIYDSSEQNEVDVSCDTIVYQTNYEYRFPNPDCGQSYSIVKTGNYNSGSEPLYSFGDIWTSDTVILSFNNHVDYTWYSTEWIPYNSNYIQIWDEIAEPPFNLTFDHPIGLFAAGFQEFGDIICLDEDNNPLVYENLVKDVVLIFEEKPPEQYLHITIPEPAEIWPTLPGGNYSGRNISSNNIIDSITIEIRRNEIPLTGKEILVTASFLSGSGGHDHDNAHEILQNGTFTDVNSGNSNAGNIDIISNSEGKNYIRYQSPEYSGKMIISAITVIEDKNYTVSDTIDIRVPGLIELQPGPNYELVGTPDNHSGTNDPCRTDPPASEHYKNHYATQDMIDAIENIASSYNSLHNSVRLRINDISLEWGGLFDIDNDFQNGHLEHRIGKQADISKRGIDLNGECLDIKNIILVQLIRKYTDNTHYNHSSHYHIRVRN
jgi:hypothetical protein